MAVMSISATTKLLRMKLKKAEASPEHTLAPLLSGLTQTTHEIGEALLNLKPQEKAKGTFQRLSDLLGTILSALLKFITVLAVVALFASILYQLFVGRRDVLLEHFEVPSELEKAGYKSEVIATHLSDQVKLISSSAVTIIGNNVGAGATTGMSNKGSGSSNKGVISLPTFAPTSTKAELDMEVPQTKFSVRSILRYIFESLGISPTRIDGEIVSNGNKLAMSIRITTNGVQRTLPTVDAVDMEELLAKGARAIYQEIEPIVLASYLYSSRTAAAGTGESEALALIKDCIYQDKEPALAYMLWGIILLNKCQYDDAVEKFKAAQGLPHDEDLDEALASCQARVQEAKGDYNGAQATYEQALGKRRSLLMLTNYASYCANRGDLNKALENYKSALSMDNESEIAHSGLGLALETQGYYEAALLEFRTAIKLNPASSLAYCNLADALARMKRYDEATDVARKATQVERDSAIAHNMLGNVFQSTSKYDEALKEFEESVRLNQYSIIGHFNFADALLNKRDYNGALGQVQEALKCDPNSAVLHNELASILISRNEYDRAIEECRKALAFDPDFGPASTNLVNALLYQKKYTEALKQSKEIVEKFNSWSDAYNMYGYVLQSSDKYDDAITQFRKSVELNRFNTYAYVNWATALQSQKKYKEAEQVARQAIELDAASSDAHNVLGYVLKAQGQLDAAVKEHEAACVLNPYNVYAYTGMADALVANKQYEAAVEKARIAVKRDPFSFDALNSLGSALANKGEYDAQEAAPGAAKRDYDEAKKTYNESARLNPYNVYAYTGLYDLFVKEGLKDDALKAARQAVPLDPQSSDAYSELGWALKETGDVVAAIENFKKANELNAYNTYALVGWSASLRKQKDFDGAEKKARAAVNLDPYLEDAKAELDAVRKRVDK
jgi:tetratricopeptide (TPR) repeat protein